MQNEDTPTEVNPFMDIAAGMSKPPAAPTIPTDNPFMDLAPSVRTVSQPPAMGSLSAVAGINPDQAAEATKLGTPLGIGQDLALRNMDELRRRSMIASVQRSGMLQNNPRLAQSLLDPVFAAQAHDDLDSLEKTSSLFDKAVNFIGPELFDRRPGQALRIAKVLEDGYAIGELGAELGALKSRRKGYIAFGGTPENETVLNDRIAFLEKQLANKEPSGFFGSAAMVTAQALAMARPVGTVALMGAGVGGAVGGPPGAAAGFVAGLQAGIVGTSAQVEGGFLFDDMVAQGVEPETAYYASVAGGTVIGMIELVGDRLFAGSFKPITRFLRQELTQQLAKPTIRSAAAEFGKQTLKQMAVGGAEEGSQRLVADAFSELGKAIDGVPTDFTWSQMAKNIASDFAAGVQGSALIGAAGPGLSLMVDVRRAEAVSAQEEFFDGLDAAKKDGKLPKRNLDAYEGFLARQAKGTTADTVYVEAEAAAQVLAQSGLSAEQLEQSIPGIREQLRNALENGGDVTIPTSVYGARLAGTTLGDALRQHVRLSPEAMSVAQAQEFSRKRDALRQEAQEVLASKQETDAAFVAEAQQVEDAAYEQISATGAFSDIESRTLASLRQAMVVVDAAEAGMTPLQYERERGVPLQVRGPQAVQEGQPLEQARREPAPEKGVFDANNPPADVTAEGSRKAIMAVMDYEGKIYYDRAATMHGDLLDSFPELDADLIIDGGFIRDGKYIPNMSDGGFAAMEGGRERLEEVKAFAEQANRRSPKVFEQAARQPDEERVLGPIEAAKKLVQDTGREVFTDADKFFKKRWDSLLKKTKRQVKPTSKNFREAAKRAVSDILEFVKNNPKFADYYANDWKVTRSILDDYVGRAVTDDEFLMFRAIAGLTSPNTMLPANISDTVGLWDYWMREGNFDAFTLGPKPGTGALVVFEAAEPISGTTANVKVRTIRIIERLIKERGGVKQALDYLQEGVPVKELHKFNRKMGYAGAVGDIGNITDLVQQATGQSELIPRMFIFGQKVGAYTLNAIGDERYTTVDIWESRYIRSHFVGMFDINIGLPESTDEHQIFTRFGELFKEEMEAVTGRKWAPSALQALRWFYIIGSAREAGYSKASTNETISFYTERRLVQAFGYPGRAATGGGPSLGAAAPGGTAGQVRAARIPPKRFERDLESDVAKLSDSSDRRRAIAAGYVRYARYNSELGQRGFSFDERRGGPARQHGILNATVAADFVPGERLKSAFGKANLPIQTMQELVADANGAQAFRSLVADTNSSNPYGAAVAVYTAEEYQGKRLFVTEDATAGFALTADGDIVSVFSAPKSGNGRALMTLAVQAGGRRLDCFDTALPSYYAAHGFKAVARLPWNDEYAPAGWDTETFQSFNAGRPDVVFMVYQRGYNGEYKAGDGTIVPDYDTGVQAQTRTLQAIEKSQVFEQAAVGAPRGQFDLRSLIITINQGGDSSTLAHELIHLRIAEYIRMARSASPSARVLADLETLFDFMGVEGATFAERLAKYDSMPLEQRRPLEESVTYNFEVYLYENKAPSVELRGVFDRLARWIRRAYKSIRDDLNAIYRREFGKDLPILTPEVRQVFDRMLATDEQIARAQAVRGMKTMFQTQEQSGMNDAEWAAYQALEQDATDAATAELTKATLKELQWYGNAQSKYLREIQSKHDRARKEIREEVSAQVQLEPVYRAMEFLKKGTIRTDTGEVTAATGAFKLDLAKVRAIMPAGFDPATLKYGKYGMVQEGGIDPDMAAGMFGYGSGVELINAILAAKPIKEEIDARTDQRMLDENSDLATPEARQAAVDMAIHNEARARFIAVEQRWLEKQRRPANDMLQAARQVAQDIIGEVVIRTLNPRRYEAAEAEAARTATTAYREPQDPSTAGQAAATRAYNEAIADGMTPDEATVAATEAGVAAVAKAREQRADFDAKYGGREPAEVARRAKRQQLVQNQLAREAMLAKEEIAVAGRDFRKFFRSDEKLAKTRDMAPIMAARAILSYYGYGKRGESPAQYLEQLRTYAPELYDGIAPIVLKSLSGTADYRDLTVTEFRVLRDTVQALWAQARRDRQITVEGERVALDVVLKEMADRLQAIGVGERVGQRQAPGPIDRANRTLLTAAALATRVETWADTLDGIGGPGPFTKYLVRPVLQAVDRFKVARNNYVKRFVDLLNTLELPVGKIAAPGLNYTFGNGNGGIGKAELLGALMHTGNESNYRKLLLGRGWGELDADGNLDDSKWRSFVNRMIAEGKLTKADYDFVQSIWDLLEEIKPIAQRAHFDMYGYYFKEIEATEVVTPFGTYRGGYVPAATDKFMVQDARVKDGIDELEADWRNSLPSTGAGFTKSRVAGYNEALSLDLSVIASHTDSVLRFSIIQPAVKDANKLLTNREFKALLARFNPVAYESMLKPWLIRTARQQAAMPGMFKALDRGLNGLRKRAALSIFVGNFRNALSNITGWFPASLKVQPRNLKSAFLVYMGDRGGTTKTITELSPFMAEVLQSQMFELQTTMNDILLNPSKYQKLQQWSDQHGLFAQRAVQNVVSIVTWLGKFNQTIVEMKKEGASEAEAQTEAIARADFAVRQTQGSQTPESISAFEFGTPFYRTFTQFGGWGNTMANLNAGEWVKTVRDLGWRSGKSRLIYIYLMGVMVPALVEDAIKRTFSSDWDPEDDETYLDMFLDWFFGSQARYAAGLVPFGSTITTALTAGFTDKTWDDRMLTSPSISVLEASTVGTAKAVVAIVDEDKDITGRNVRDVLTMITTFTGIPVSALGRPAGYLIDVERGEIEPESTYDMIRGMITGTATPESKR